MKPPKPTPTRTETTVSAIAQLAASSPVFRRIREAARVETALELSAGEVTHVHTLLLLAQRAGILDAAVAVDALEAQLRREIPTSAAPDQAKETALALRKSAADLMETP